VTTPRISDRSFEQFLAEKRLMGSQCASCSKIWVPPRPLCPDCHKNDMQWVEMAGTGTLAAFTSISICPPWMAQLGFGRENPYCTGVVRLDEGPRIVARIDGVDARHPERIDIGLPLAIRFPDKRPDTPSDASDDASPEPRWVFAHR
jgi:hypothetical protein